MAREAKRESPVGEPGLEYKSAFDHLNQRWTYSTAKRRDNWWKRLISPRSEGACTIVFVGDAGDVLLTTLKEC